jgi:6-phosphogluconolactonase
MTLSRTLIFPDHETLSRAAAIYFAQAAEESITARGRFLVALCGGETPVRLYETLAMSPWRDYIPWQHIHFFWGDERCVPADDPESNYHLAWQHWLKHIPIPAANIHRIQGELEPEKAAGAYQLELKKFTEEGQDWPSLDWVLLGLGTDGHTASLFPGSSPIPDANFAVMAVKNDSLGRLARRVSLTPMLINRSRQVVFLVSGAEKAPALAATIKRKDDPLRWPAQCIMPDNGLLVWMVDESAALEPSSKINEVPTKRD